MTELTPAGWYPDPQNPAQQRYWDGNAWTDHFAPVAAAPVETVSATPVAKKPFYKRAWFIVLAVLIVLGAVGNMVGGSTESDSNTTPSATQSVPTEKAAEAAAETTGQDAAAAEQPAATEEAVVAEEPAAPEMTMGQEQATQKAQSYLEMGGFSRKGLIEQLKFEGFSKSDATFAVDYIDPDWNAQADTKAQSYVDMGGFSRKSLIDQLEFEGFTSAQAKHGAKAVGY